MNEKRTVQTVGADALGNSEFGIRSSEFNEKRTVQTVGADAPGNSEFGIRSSEFGMKRKDNREV